MTLMRLLIIMSIFRFVQGVILLTCLAAVQSYRLDYEKTYAGRILLAAMSSLKP